MVAANYFHYGVEPANEIVVPGTDIKVVKTYGLAGSLTILGTSPKFLVYGTDLESDMEDIKMWYSEDNDTTRFRANWTSGIQMAFPDYVVTETFAAAPSL